MVHPSSNVNLVVKITNSCFEEFNRKTKILQEKSIVQKIQNNVIEILNARHPKLFESLDLHVDNQRLDNCVSHRVLFPLFEPFLQNSWSLSRAKTGRIRNPKEG